jgi:hypothetical protein
MAKLTHTPLRTMKRYSAGTMVPTFDKGIEIIRQLLGFSTIGFEFLDIDQKKKRLQTIVLLLVEELGLSEPGKNVFIQKGAKTLSSLIALLNILIDVLNDLVEKDKKKTSSQKNKGKILVKKDK